VDDADEVVVLDAKKNDEIGARVTSGYIPCATSFALTSGAYIDAVK
jgi:hypothetical protein